MLTFTGHKVGDVKKVVARCVMALETQSGEVFDAKNFFQGYIDGTVITLDGGAKTWVRESINAVEAAVLRGCTAVQGVRVTATMPQTYEIQAGMRNDQI